MVCRPYTDTLSTANTEPDLLPDADMSEGLLPGVLHAFHVDSGVDTGDPVKLENFKVLGSYNWIDAPQPTILVPGSPPEWRDRPLPFRVPPDSGIQVFDPNGYYMGSTSTLIPLFRAVDVVAEDNADTSMDWGAVDFVIDRSSLRKILRWVRCTNADASSNTPTTTNTTTNAKWNTNGNKPHQTDTTTNNTPRPAHTRSWAQRDPRGAGGVPHFRLDLQLAGKKTVLVERWDTRTCQELLHGSHGCRNNFDEAATSPARGPKSTKYHNRIVQYDLEGVRLVVRFEADAYIPRENDPADLLSGLSISCSPSPPAPSPSSPPTPDYSDTNLAVLHGGTLIPQSSLIEIATRTSKGRLTHKWHETYTQLLLSQTPHFFLAVHQNGQFSAVERHARRAAGGTSQPGLERFDRDARMQRDLRQLVRVLGTMQGLVRGRGRRGRLSLVHRQGRLELFERDGDAGRLPESELARFGI
ncbi:hypothetical protein C8Q78DRAFT_974591 [Trametes maxima]|nr:hypothetical protein C8Q78DRAFT_974591 [Trametes maxima]